MCRVLVIEDEWLLAEYISDLAQRAGATSVVTAASEAEAIAAAETHHPQIILSDVMLASGTGPHAVRAIMEREGPIPVIFITGTPERCVPCDPPGIVIEKPIVEREVIAAFREMAPV